MPENELDRAVGALKYDTRHGHDMKAADRRDAACFSPVQKRTSDITGRSGLMNVRQYCCWLVMLTLVSFSGCGGCRPDDTEKLSREELEKRRREQREAIELSDLMTLPADSELQILTAKPGHWQETQQQFKSNREDLQVVAVGSVYRGTELVRIPGTNTINDFARRTSLPKGQTKTVDLQYYVPYTGETKEEDEFSIQPSSSLSFGTELLSWPLMTPILAAPVRKPARELKPHEYQLVVLSPQALSYEYLSGLDTVSWRADADMFLEERTRSYQVMLNKPKDNRYAFPRSMLSMTAIAVIVWDDVSVDDLSVDQQNALLDWLHWGGQLLISGPSSWSRLQNSFLSPYLPANSAQTSDLTTESFVEISNMWAVEDLSEKGTRDLLTIEGAAIGGLQFNLNSRGSWLPGSGELVAETSVGRGRIVITGFPMREPRIYRWRYYSNLLSTGLLRRHSREIVPKRSEASGNVPFLVQQWANPFSSSTDDPRLHSNVRILSRDLPAASSVLQAVGEGGFPVADLASSKTGVAATADAKSTEAFRLNAPPTEQLSSREDIRWGGGGAAWSDNSALARAAVVALKSAAGIELPSRQTIMWLIAGYLACLVPLNWLVFRVIRRLEFAWIAAPIMALIGVVVVTKVARLDIGFARRTTEVSLLELQGDYPRGHLTQYLAMYTSLSTNYAIEFPENGSVALPFGELGRTQLRAASDVRNVRTNFGSSAGVRLEPVTVYSNSTEMLHAEQLITLPGSLLLNTPDVNASAVKNETGLNLKSALVLRRLESGVIEKSWIGDLDAGVSTKLEFVPLDPATALSEWANDVSTNPEPIDAEASETDVDSLWIGGILYELLRKTPLMPGQTRLFGYTDSRPGELHVTPGEDQFDGRCVVVAHLSAAHLGQVYPDKSIMSRTKTTGLDVTDPAAQPTDDDEASSGL
ncbi:MAG: hypothetical protein R3C53_04605 [Pirellulaceae bacterium]